jgi:hypothetical protein
MIESLGRRLSLMFDRSGTDGDEPPASHPGAAVLHPLVDFVAYAQDCTLSGRLRLRAERLTDMLNEHEELALRDVMVQSLAEPRAMEVTEVVVPRSELLLVHATGPRGNQARRTRTRQAAVAITIGPYELTGYLHGVPGLDVLASIHRRHPMIPLTDAQLEFDLGDLREHLQISTIIVNRERIDAIAPTLEHLDPVPEYAVAYEKGPLLKDFTGDIVGGPLDETYETA